MPTEAEQLYQALRAQREQKKAPVAPVRARLPALTGSLAERIIDNAMGVVDMPAKAFQEGRGLVRGMTGQGPMPSLMGEPGPRESVLPLPSGREVLSSAQGLLPDSTYETALRGRESIAQQHPVLSGAGNLLGDAAFLAGPRVPRTPDSRYGGMFDKGITDLLNAFSNSRRVGPGDVGLERQIQEVIDSDLFRDLARGAGRAGETGLEAAYLSVIQGEDPLESAAWAAGAQGVSSGMLSWAAATGEAPAEALKKMGLSKGGLLMKGTLGLAFNAALMTTVFNVIGDNPDAAESAAYDKVAYALLGGMLLGTPGKRTKPEGLLHNFPNLGDAFLTIPRAALIDGAQAIAADPVSQKVLEVAMTTPEAFSETKASEMLRWLEEGKFAEKARELYESSEEFREMIDLPPSLRGVPTKREPQRRRNRGPGFES